ncbi:MAG: uridine kinase [Clostridium sp.]
MRPILIGITGGTGSGKSTVANEIYNSLPSANICMIQQDSYYKDQSHLSHDERIKTNYDHPNAFDTDLLLSHLKTLIEGKSIDMPIYDFSIHNRTEETKKVPSCEVIILEGLMVLVEKEIRDLLDIKIFVDTDADLRIVRRIKRDIEERGRTLESVITQYTDSVRPMHLEFIEPTKRYADVIIPEGGYNKVAIDIMKARIKQVITDTNIN